MNESIVNENVIEWYRGENIASVTAHSGSRLKNKLLKLAERPEVVIEVFNKDGSIFAHVPVEWVKIIPPKKLSDEQRQQLAERMKSVRQDTANGKEVCSESI